MRMPPEEVQRLEHAIIRLRLDYYTHQQIADILQIKRYRVHDAIMRVYRRLGVHSTEELSDACFGQEGQ